MNRSRNNSTSAKQNSSSSTAQQPKKQSWYSNFRQKRSKKVNQQDKVDCCLAGTNHWGKIVYKYHPVKDDRYLKCTYVLECCAETNLVGCRLNRRQAVLISEPLIICYTDQYHYNPDVCDAPNTLCLLEIEPRCQITARKPKIISDVSVKIKTEDEAFGNLTEPMKMLKPQDSKELTRRLRIDVDNNVILCPAYECKEGTQEKQGVGHGTDMQCDTDNVNNMPHKLNMQSDIDAKYSQIQNVRSQTDVSVSNPDIDVAVINTSSHEFLTKEQVDNMCSRVIGNTDNLRNDDSVVAMAVFNYKGSDITGEVPCPSGAKEGTSDYYMSMPGFVAQNLKQITLPTNEPEVPHSRISSLSGESSGGSKRLKEQHPNEDETKLLDMDQNADPNNYADGEGTARDRPMLDVADRTEEQDIDVLMHQGNANSFYSYHVAASLMNNTSAIMLLIDHKLASGDLKLSGDETGEAPTDNEEQLPPLDSDIQYFKQDGEDFESSELTDIFQYGDPEDTIGQDNLLMSFTHSHMKKMKKSTDSKSKSIGTSVSKAFTDALSKLEEISHDSRNKQFHKLFPEVPDDEEVINTYSCALCREILLHGRMFVSPNWICFHSNIFTYETQVVVRVSSIAAITKEKTAIVVPNAIGIVTTDEKHVFGSLLSRRATHKQLMKIWKGSAGTEDDEDHSSTPASEDTDSECVNTYLPQPSEVSVDSSELVNGSAVDDIPVPKDLDVDDEDGVAPRKRAASYIRNSSVEREDTILQSTKQNCSKLSRVVCAMSVFKSLLRIFGSLRGASQTQIFLGLTIILLIGLTTSALVISHRISQLQPQLQETSWMDSVNPTPESFEGSLLEAEANHKHKVVQIQDALTSYLDSLSKIHSSLELLHHSTFLEKDQNDDDSPKDIPGR